VFFMLTFYLGDFFQLLLSRRWNWLRRLLNLGNN
jgi:hypothetical protein